MASNIMSHKPLISVVIPTKDRPADLAQALASVGAQTYPNVEVVVIDDGSTLELGGIMDTFRCNHPGVLLSTHKNHLPMGGGYCRKLGTELASGEFVCFLDDDDIYLSSKLETLANYLLQNVEVDAVFGRVIVRKENHSDILLDYSQYRKPLEKMSDITRLQTNGSLVRSSALRKANFDPRLKKFQDTQFHIELCRKVNCHLIETPVAIWHKSYSSGQVSHIDKNNGASVIDRFDELFNSLVVAGVLTKDDESFLFNQRLKYTARFAPLKAALFFSFKKSPVALLKFLMYRAYYVMKSGLFVSK